MLSLNLIEKTARQAELSAAFFAMTLRDLSARITALEGQFRIRISNDGPLCISLFLINENGKEAGLSVEADFSTAHSIVYLLREESCGDLSTEELVGADAVEHGMLLVLEHISK